MLKILLTFFCALIMTGCGPRYEEFYPYHEDGTAKPSVALLPIIINDGKADLAAHEIEQVCRYQALCEGNLYVLGSEELQGQIEALQNFDFLADDHQLVECFNNVDFVVVSELIDQEFFPYGQGAAPMNTTIIAYPCNHLVVLKMRLKVIDVRRRCARVVLQEVFTRGYYVPNCTPGSEGLQKAYYRFGSGLNQRLNEAIQCHR